MAGNTNSETRSNAQILSVLAIAVLLALVACSQPQPLMPDATSTPAAALAETPVALPIIANTAAVRTTVPPSTTATLKPLPTRTATATRAAPIPSRPNVPKLSLTMTAPKDETIATTSTISVTGQTSVGAVVSVNGDLVDVDAGGRFRTNVALDEGPNTIEVEASDINGNELGTVLSVIYEP